ncbi:MAG: aconitate hydratase [Planctomycetota bacterium]
MATLDISAIRAIYEKAKQRHAEAREKLGRPLTLAEKVLFAHATTMDQDFVRGKSFVQFAPDRVAMQDATAQMALLQFMHAGRKEAAVPSTVHCDHLIQAYIGNDKDLDVAIETNREVYDFLKSVSNKFGLGFWEPGSGIIHQVVLENYAFPGGMMLGTDSHTPNAGGLGMIAVGVGGADAVDVMAGMPWEVKYPKLIGVKLRGSMSGWTSGKDVIMKLCGILTVKGGTDRIVEYFGDGTQSISCTGKGTITNMGAELGATTSIFPYDSRMADYLKITERSDIAALADEFADCLRADPEVAADPKAFYDELIEINLDELEPHVVGPHSPDLARPISQMKLDVVSEDYPANLTSALIGSCTNSSYEDIGRSVHVAKQAAAKGLKAATQFWVSPGSDQIFETMKRDGQLEALEKVGATVLANACGPCIGQWRRDDVKKGDRNSIVTSFNRNFRGRNDTNPETLSFITSPEITTAMAFAGDLRFNPITDELTAADGSKFKLEPPTAKELPEQGFAKGDQGYVAPAANGEQVNIVVADNSERLELLKKFQPWDGKDYQSLPILVKAKGKCTTDHISPAGAWLRFRGHLDHISDNMYTGAINAFSGETGHGKNPLTGEKGQGFPQIARALKAEGLGWVAIGDANYGEGSSREHAAMSPRFLGAKVVITRSFARIAETNLKKQGVLPMTFADAADYDRIDEDDRISVAGLNELTPGKSIAVTIEKPHGQKIEIECLHSLNNEQIAWFKAGSALNLIAAQQA